MLSDKFEQLRANAHENFREENNPKDLFLALFLLDFAEQITRDLNRIADAIERAAKKL